MSGFQLGVIGALFLSVASSVSIVICNKALMSNLGFPFGDNHFCPLFENCIISVIIQSQIISNQYLKYLILLTLNYYFFHFWPATTLTSWHLMVTFCTLHAAQRLNLFVAKSIDLKTVMLFGFLNGISIGFLNLSLGFNSVGFYQVNNIILLPQSND